MFLHHTMTDSEILRTCEGCESTHLRLVADRLRDRGDHRGDRALRVEHEPLEHAHRECQVAVLLHVEVDELGAGGCGGRSAPGLCSASSPVAML